MAERWQGLPHSLPGKSSTTEIRELDRVTSKLRITDSRPHKDAGRYDCEAANAYGKSHFSIDVTIWGKLSAAPRSSW